jgi:acyl-CoA reductase-like NAD-dependent aldehyde dehydrogenase
VESRLHRYGNARSRTTSFVPTVNPHDRESAMQTITKHYIDGTFVESHGSEVMDIIKPTNGQVLARVALADEEDTRYAIAAAKSAFATFGRSTKEERTKILRRLHQAASARVDDLSARPSNKARKCSSAVRVTRKDSKRVTS